MVDGADVVDRDGELRVPLVDAVFLPIFVSGLRVFELPIAAIAPRRDRATNLRCWMRQKVRRKIK
jgi:hypothetical protein